MSIGTIPFGTAIKFNSKLSLPTAFNEIDMQATSDYNTVSYIAKIKFNGVGMSYNDGNMDYTVYSVGKWASTDAQNIITADDYEIQSEAEKQWWLNNSDLTTQKIITKTIKGDNKNMSEIILNRPNWLGSSEDIIRKTATVTQSSGAYVEEKDANGNVRKILKSGTLISDYSTTLGYGLLWNDADVTDGGRVAAIMIAGRYIDSKLPASVSAQATTLAGQGLYSIEYPETKIAYGEVTE